MDILIIAILAILILVFIASQRTRSIVPKNRDYPYEKLGLLLTPAERSFFGVLNHAVEDKALIFSKVRVADVLRTTKGLDPSNRTKAFNRISSKHFDFVICDPNDLRVTCVIELDDSSHASKKVQLRDEFINKACDSAQLALYRVKVKNSYAVTEIRELIFPSTTIKNDLPLNAEDFDNRFDEENQRRECPMCSSPLVKKQAKRGQHVGKNFLACSSYPKCKYIAP